MFGLFLCALDSTSAFAQGGGSGKYEGTLSGGLIGIGGGLQLDLAPAFYIAPLASFPWLQAGGEISWQRTSYRGGAASSMFFLGGITANVSQPMNQAFYVSLGLAYKKGDGGTGEDITVDDPGGIGFHFLIGKRIPIAGNIMIKPNMGIISTGTSSILFRPIAVSIFF